MNPALILLVVISFFSFGATSCTGEEETGEILSKLKLTPEWTNDTRVSYYDGGGMVNEYTRFEIYTDSASYTMHRDQSTNKYKLKFTKAELDHIATLFYDANFTLLRATKHELIYDKGTRSITICKGGECEEKGSGATESYTGKQGEILYKLQNDVLAIVQKKLAELPQSKIKIVFDNSLLNSAYNYTLEFAPSPINFASEEKGRLNEATVELPGGTYAVHFYTYKNEPNAFTKYGGSGDLQLNTNEYNFITISMQNDSTVTLTPSKK